LELSRLVEELERDGQIAPQDRMEAVTALRGLSTDRELYASLEPLITEANARKPDEAKIAQIQSQRLKYMTGVRATVEPVARRSSNSLRLFSMDSSRVSWNVFSEPAASVKLTVIHEMDEPDSKLIEEFRAAGH
jgi:hypothetical protein